MADALAERRREQRRLRAVAERYVEQLATRLPLRAAALVGSAARGDFNVWSDVDVVVVGDELPERLPERSLLLAEDAAPGVQPIGYTTEEFERAFRRGDPLAREAVEPGAALRGESFFVSFRGR